MPPLPQQNLQSKPTKLTVPAAGEGVAYILYQKALTVRRSVSWGVVSTAIGRVVHVHAMDYIFDSGITTTFTSNVEIVRTRMYSQRASWNISIGRSRSIPSGGPPYFVVSNFSHCQMPTSYTRIMVK